MLFNRDESSINRYWPWLSNSFHKRWLRAINYSAPILHFYFISPNHVLNLGDSPLSLLKAHFVARVSSRARQEVHLTVTYDKGTRLSLLMTDWDLCWTTCPCSIFPGWHVGNQPPGDVRSLWFCSSACLLRCWESGGSPCLKSISVDWFLSRAICYGLDLFLSVFYLPASIFQRQNS